jgi:hypothetical protein
MSAFWLSIALGIALAQTSSSGNRPARLRRFLFCLLVLSGFAEIRLEQIALVPSGGYLWGTYGMDSERRIRSNMQSAFASREPGQIDTLVLEDCAHPSPYSSMVLLDAPAIQRILVYDSRTGSYNANDLMGLRPNDSSAGVSDWRSYNWDQPLDASAVAGILARTHVLRIECPTL